VEECNRTATVTKADKIKVMNIFLVLYQVECHDIVLRRTTHKISVSCDQKCLDQSSDDAGAEHIKGNGLDGIVSSPELDMIVRKWLAQY
jgi:hypothetical protein